MKQNHKRVVIVGASSGIGRALALHFAADGAQVAIAARRQERLQQIAAEYPQQIVYAPLDVTAPDAESSLEALIGQLGGMDVCIISAGVGSQNPQLDREPELSTLAVNSFGFTRMAIAAFNHFRHNGGGHLVAITSIAGTRGLGIAPAYSATKRYQTTYMESLTQLAAIERLPIVTTVIKPGFIDTELIAGSHFPATLSLPYASRLIYRAILKQRPTVVINWLWRVVVMFWHLIPRPLWVKMRIK